jgi:hypothetical protein
MIAKIFPYTLIVLDLAASTVYFYSGDIRRGVYWFAAAVLTACVTL